MGDPRNANTSGTKLHVFISHAGEDIDIARALQNAIENLCDPNNVDVFLDFNHISSGDELAGTIQDALGTSDYFIGIATHNLRNQFSWCGLELGYFLSRGKESREICYLYHKDILDVFKPYLGTQIVRLTDANKQVLSVAATAASETPIYRLLIQIGVEASRRCFPRDPFKFFESMRTAAQAGAIAITEAYAEQLNLNMRKARYPQGRVKVTLPVGITSATLPTKIKEATVGIYPKAGFVLEIPGAVEDSPAELTWDAFGQQMTINAGGPHLSLIMYEIIDDFLPSQFDAKNDYLFKAPNSHSYRVILVRYAMFGDGRSEFVFSLIETLVPLTGGDSRTTLITSGIVMATQYRSLFIENDATYSCASLAAMTGDEFMTAAKGIVRDLRRIHIESATLGVGARDDLKKALGSPDLVEGWFADWWPPVEKVEELAQAYIDAASDVSKTAFLAAHREMIEKTSKINRQFTSLCLDVYKNIIDGSRDGESGK
jgi:TIR domain